LYCPAGSAGMVKFPLSRVCTVLMKPVVVLTAVTVALATLPLELSVIRPERVAFTACAWAVFVLVQIRNTTTEDRNIAVAADQKRFIRHPQFTSELTSKMKMVYIRVVQVSSNCDWRQNSLAELCA
jgi:hypothetical protein